MYDLQLFQNDPGICFLSGTDEVGRGCLAGPVVSSCVTIYQNKRNKADFCHALEILKDLGIRDSKKISEKKRAVIVRYFTEKLDVDKYYHFSISKNTRILMTLKSLSSEVVDEMNILQASLYCMKQAFLAQELELNKGIVLIDGNKSFDVHPRCIPVVKGDQKSLIIGLASIFAKEFRDQYMKNLAKNYLQYSWDKNVGYGTREHLLAIEKFGVTKYHRRTFRGVKEFLC